MKVQKVANHFFEYLLWFGILIILAFSVYNDGGIDILSHLFISASLIVFGVVYYIRKNPLKFGVEIIPLLFFITFFVLSFIFSQTKNVGLLELILFVSGVFMYLSFSSQKWDIVKFEKFLFGVLVIGVIATLYGYFHYIFDPFNRFSATFGESIYKFVGYPNAYANFILAVIPIPFYFLHKKTSGLNKAFLLFSITIMLAAFFLTYSRGAYIVLAVVAVPYLFGLLAANRRNFKEGIKKIGVIVLLIIMSAGLTIPVNQLRQLNHPDVNSFTEKITLESAEKDTSTSDRIDFWEGSVKMFAANSVFGTGPGSFQYVFPMYQKTLLGNSNSPHNLFFKLLIENGLFTMVCFVLFLIVLIVRVLKAYKKISQSDRLIMFALSASVFGSLLHNMIDYNLNFVSTILLLFIFLGMTAFIVNKYSDAFIVGAKSRLTRAFFVLVGLLMCFISLHEVYYSYIFIQARAAHKQDDFAKADIYYEKSQNIFLKRDLFVGYAQMNVEKYKEDGDTENLKKAEKFLLTGLELNKYDAFIVNFLGDIAFEMNKLEEAKLYYARALELDPKNNLDYYYDNLNVDNDLTREKIESTLDLLADYHNKLANNAHLTILTGNPDAAVMMYELLLSKIKDTEFFPDYNEKILKELKEMQDTYALEKSKFEKYYNLQLTKED